MGLIIFMVSAFTLRILSLFVSIKHEKALKKNGGVEYGKGISISLAVLHTVFYLVSFYVGWMKRGEVNNLMSYGLVLYIFSIIMLFAVMKALGKLWSVKLIIAKEHVLIDSLIFKYFKHPNYFLNIVPELIGLTMIMNSWNVFIVLFPIYMINLFMRIKLEERVMKDRFPKY